MAWPKGKPRKMAEPVKVQEPREPTLVEINRQAQESAKGRHEVSAEIVAIALAAIRERLGPDYAARAAAPMRALVRAIVEKGTLPGVKNKPLRGPVEKAA